MTVALDADLSTNSESFPLLSPVAVAPAESVEPVLHAARADIARLQLQLRASTHAADEAEAETADLPAPSLIDLSETREFLRSALDHRVTSRRRELANEIASVREEAARLVAAANSEAAAVIDAARGELLQSLLGETAPQVAAPPTLRVVHREVPSPEHPAGSTRSFGPGMPQGVEAAPATEKVAAEQLLQMLRDVVAAQAPQTAAAPAPAPPHAAPAPPHAAPAPGPIFEVPPQRSKTSGVARFMYLDVILPLIAVLIVIVVLLAWVG